METYLQMRGGSISTGGKGCECRTPGTEPAPNKNTGGERSSPYTTGNTARAAERDNPLRRRRPRSSELVLLERPPDRLVVGRVLLRRPRLRPQVVQRRIVLLRRRLAPSRKSRPVLLLLFGAKKRRHRSLLLGAIVFFFGILGASTSIPRRACPWASSRTPSGASGPDRAALLLLRSRGLALLHGLVLLGRARRGSD